MAKFIFENNFFAVLCNIFFLIPTAIIFILSLKCFIFNQKTESKVRYLGYFFFIKLQNMSILANRGVALHVKRLHKPIIPWYRARKRIRALAYAHVS